MPRTRTKSLEHRCALLASVRKEAESTRVSALLLANLSQGFLRCGRASALEGVSTMKLADKLVNHPSDNMLIDVGGWVASLVVWSAGIAMCLAIVCFMLGQAE